MTDPYRPFPIGPTAEPAQFPRARLERAGVPAASIDELESAFPGLPDEERDALVGYVNGHSDAAIAERFGDGVPPSAPTEESLMEETVDALEDRIRKWNAEHDDDPDAHLAVSGRKVELVARLLDAYAGDEGTDSAPPAAPAPAAGSASTVATGTVPTAPTPTTPEGAPTGTQAAGTAGDTPAATATTGTTTTGGTP